MNRRTTNTRSQGGNQRAAGMGAGRGKTAKGKADDGEPVRIYTVNDIAELMQFEPVTIYRMYRKGELPDPLPIGRSLRWNANTFDTWVNDGCPKIVRRVKKTRKTLDKTAPKRPRGKGK